MRIGLVMGAGIVAAGLVLSSGLANAQDDTRAEIERYKQRIDALERKVEQLERATRENIGASEEQIEKVAQRLAKQKEKPTDFNVFWKDGLNFETRDKQIKLNIGGRLYYDAAWLSEDSDTRQHVLPETGKAIGDQLDGTEVRTARLHMAGTLFENTDFKLELDFSGAEKTLKTSTVVLKDAYLGFKDLVPFGYVRVGHFKEPFGLEEITSSRFITFMERSLATSAFAPTRNAGVQLSNTALSERATWAVGIFRDTDDRGYGQSEGGYNVTGRITGLPWYEEEGKKLLHLGAAISCRRPQDTVQYSTRPENHLASKYLDTGAFDADSALLIGAEAAIVYGPFSAQAECMQSHVNRPGGDDVSFSGGYVQASYFLTGESRAYSKSSGAFGRVRPAANFGKTKEGGRGWGAWELAARYSYLDLNDSDIRGGRLGDATLGVNWHLNPNVRIMANYTRAMLADNGSSEGGNSDLLGIRFQVDF